MLQTKTLLLCRKLVTLFPEETDGHTDGKKNGQTDRRAEKQIDRHTSFYFVLPFTKTCKIPTILKLLTPKTKTIEIRKI